MPTAKLTRTSAASLAIALLAASGFTLPLRAVEQTDNTAAPAIVRAPGAKVQIRTGHTVTYDLKSDQVIRSVHTAGTLT